MYMLTQGRRQRKGPVAESKIQQPAVPEPRGVEALRTQIRAEAKTKGVPISVPPHSTKQSKIDS